MTPREPDRQRRAFAWLTRLLPGEFRDQHGDELEEALRLDHAETRERGRPLGRFWLRAVLGVAGAAARAHLDDLRLDLRLAGRTLLREPLFAGVAVLSLGLGLAASVTVVALFEATFLAEIEGAAHAGRLVNVQPTWEPGAGAQFASYPDYLELAAGATTVELAGFHGLQLALALSEAAEPELATGQVVTSNYFPVLGVRPRAGRFFTPEEEHRRAPVAVVSSAFAQGRLGGAGAVGRELWVNGSKVTVVGVADRFRGHFLGFDFDLFLPASLVGLAGLPDLGDRTGRWVEMVGGLREGATVDDARSDLEVQVGRLASRAPELDEREVSVVVERSTGIDADLRGGLLAFLLLLAGVALSILLVACLNVAGMLVSRALARRRELAVRQALGAPRFRLHRQMVTETAVIAGLAGVVGVLGAQLVARWARAAFAALDSRISLEVRISPSTVLAAAGIAILVTFAAALAPALATSRLRFGAGLRSGAGVPGAGGRLRSALVVGQIALTLTVLVGALLFLRALERAAGLDPGFEPAGVYALLADPDLLQLPDPEARSLLAELHERAQGLPGVQSAALAERVPLSLGARFFPNPIELRIPGHEPPADRPGFTFEHNVVSAGYFETLGIPLLSGRAFRASDRGGSPVAIVNQSFASRYFEVDGPLGRTVFGVEPGGDGTGDGTPLEIVGVVADSRARALDERPAPHVYLPFEQVGRRRGVLLVRGATAAAVARPVHDLVRELAPNLPIADAATLEQRLSVSLLPQRIAAAVTATLGGAGLFLAAVGLYGVLAHGVQRRAREIGLRASLGAGPRDLVGLIVGQGARVALLGAAIGVPLAIAASRALRGLLYGLSPLDPTSWLVVGAMLAAAALAASVLPARRAAAIDPITVLRSE